ncbi:MAG: hypothetical protein FJZ87_16135 [Chloroflexi bacterium]|nr:hypothetical protein [Chloroflexota bacterium]
MTRSNETLRSLEYTTLRSELLQNKQYVFERPLLIITAAGVASVQLSREPVVVLLPILLVFILLINLWFTVNRLRSMARIAAYIEVVLESDDGKRWIGWEKSLRMHRIWMKLHSQEERKTMLKPYIEQAAIPDAMMFYPPIFWLHGVMVILAVAVALITGMKSPEISQVIASWATLLVGLVFGGYCIGPYRPGKMTNLIEVQRAIWIVVLGRRKRT